MLSRSDHENYEQDYIEIDGLLHVRRLTEAQPLKSAMNGRVAPYWSSPIPIYGNVRFKPSSAKALGSNETPYYVQLDDPVGQKLARDGVEIRAQAVFYGLKAAVQ